MSQATVRSSFCMCFLSDSGVFVLPRDSEVTLGSFAVHFGRRFGTKLGGVLVQKSCVSGRQGGGFGAC